MPDEIEPIRNFTVGSYLPNFPWAIWLGAEKERLDWAQNPRGGAPTYDIYRTADVEAVKQELVALRRENANLKQQIGALI